MKKSLIVLTAALSFGFAAAQTAPAAQVPTLTDVPAGHWAKDAIDKIVAKGIILGYPDGTFRGTQNLTRYEAAVIVARLLDQIAQGTVTTTMGTTTTVGGEELTALQNAVQELAADLAALGVRVTDLEANSVSQDDFARLEAQVNDLTAAAGDPAALTALNQQIADLTARTDDLQANYDGLRADVDDNASSIAALNDLTVLLNNDILGLQDRVSAVETAQADFVTRADFNTLGTKVTGIDTRVTTLENAPKISFTGNLEANYGGIGLRKGTTAFDVDRLTRKTFANEVYSAGKNCPATAGQRVFPEVCTDTTQNFSGYDFNFGLKVTNIVTANGQLVINDAVANFGLNSPANTIRFDNATANGKLAGQPFGVVYNRTNSAFRFNDYLFNNDADGEPANTRNGTVATISATNLPFSPKLTVVTGTASTGVADPAILLGAGPGVVGNTVLTGNYYGVRAEVNPFNLGTIGLNYAQNIGNRSAVGLDANFKVGPINLKGVYDVSSLDSGTYTSLGDAFSKAQKAGYVEASADFGIAKVAANFRAIDPQYADGVAGMSGNDTRFYNLNSTNANSNSYGADVFGYGAGLSTTLGPVTVAAFGDRKADYIGTAPSYRTAFGVAAGVKLFGVKLVGFYNSATQNTTNVYIHSTDDFAYNSTAAYQDTALVPYAFSSTYGGVLSHDGSAADALVKGLNFTIADGYYSTDAINDFQAYGSYAATVFGLTVTPFARYHSFNVPGNNGSANTVTKDGTNARTYNAVKYGAQISSTPLAIFGQPSIQLAFANAITNPGTGLSVGANTKTELFGQAALTLNDIGIAGLKPSIGYAYYQGFNIGSGTAASSASGGTATFSPTADRFFRSPLSGGVDPYTGGEVGAGTVNVAAASTQGVFAQIDYVGLKINYGMFYYTDFTNAANNSVAQAFKVGYNVKF